MMIHPPTTRPTRRALAVNAALAVVLGTAITVTLDASGEPDRGGGTPTSTSPGVSYTIVVPTPPSPVDR